MYEPIRWVNDIGEVRWQPRLRGFRYQDGYETADHVAERGDELGTLRWVATVDTRTIAAARLRSRRRAETAARRFHRNLLKLRWS